MLKGFGRKRDSDSLADLTADVQRLGDQRAARLFRSFGEEKMAVARVGVLTFILVWVLFWCYGPEPIMVADAWSVLPWAIGILSANVLWLLPIRSRLIPSEARTVQLPLAFDQSHTSLSVLDSLAVHRGLFPPLRCIVFEDMPSTQFFIGRILELAGHTVTFHDRGDHAAAKIAAAKADLVFLDLHLPGVSGLDVLRDLVRKRAVAAVPPVVVLTADVTKQAAETSYASGATEYIVKPLSATKLLRTIERLHPVTGRDEHRARAAAAEGQRDFA
jgi:CheY-like chemotaxis protein